MLNLSLGVAAQPEGPMLSPTDIHTKVVPWQWNLQFELSLSCCDGHVFMDQSGACRKELKNKAKYGQIINFKMIKLNQSPFLSLKNQE